ncbi:uncharacterized protein LOC128549641 [Mercenaria mercenaria]|uniref:uncharacterized protein LOC128549641 n=1 Tax=Mercenaria mercenaria TaxID=6596 RepID=UPI00234FB35A|nr:uncharacterized protein LOC128549641 [Mercenaria mercenaria]
MTSISPFVIEKTLESVAGVPKSVKKLRTGDLLVEVEKSAHARNLLDLTSFFNRPCKCIAHRTLNSSRGVIRCPDLAGVSGTEIVQGLADQHVTAARRVKIKRDGKEIITNTIILTFGVPFLPSSVKVGYLHTKVTQYIPNPLQCYNCFKFGHNESNCKGEFICHKCKQSGFSHEPDRCKGPLCCVNCGEEHSARSRDCKTWRIEKEVLNVKFTQGIGFPEARRIANAEFMPLSLTTTYSSVTKSNTNKSTTFFDASTQTDSEPVPNIPKEKPKITEKPKQTSQVQTAATKPTLPPAVQNVPSKGNTYSVGRLMEKEQVMGIAK